MIDVIERDVESYFTRQIKKQIGKKVMCLKFVSPGQRGVPDRVVLLDGGTVIFVELKKPGKKERALQRYVQDLIRRLGFKVFSSVDTKTKADEVIRYCREAVQDVEVSVQ